jgi:hypothetical protein
MKRITLTIVAVLVSASAAMAQNTQFYGPSGQYRGSAVAPPFGGTGSTQFLGPRGEYQGSAVTQPRPFGGTGGNTQFYGPSGDYLGSAHTAPRPFGNFR